MLLLLMIISLLRFTAARPTASYKTYEIYYTASISINKDLEGAKLAYWLPGTRSYEIGWTAEVEYQTMELVEVINAKTGEKISPDMQIIRTDEGNCLALIDAEDVEPIESAGAKIYNLTFHLKITVRYAEIKMSKEGSGKLSDIPIEMKEKYCKPTEYWEVNDPELKRIADEITTSDNVYEIVKSIYDYVRTFTPTTELERYKRSGKRAILERKGVCQDLSDAMITLCRIKGVPARLVVGMAVETSIVLREGTISLGPHGWVEVFIPPWGWMTMDPSIWYFGARPITHITWGVIEEGYGFYNPQDMRIRGIMLCYVVPYFDQYSCSYEYIGSFEDPRPWVIAYYWAYPGGEISGEVRKGTSEKPIGGIFSMTASHFHDKNIQVVYGNQIDDSMCYKYLLKLTSRRKTIESQDIFLDAIMLGGPLVNSEAAKVNSELKRYFKLYIERNPTRLTFYISGLGNLTVTGRDYGKHDYAIIFYHRKFETLGSISSYRHTVFLEGLTMYGTWAAAVYLQKMWMSELEDYTLIVIEWNDTNNNGVVDIDEISVVFSQ